MADQLRIIFLKRALFILCIFSLIFSSYRLDMIPVSKSAAFYIPPVNYLEFISTGSKSFFADVFYVRGILSLSDSYPDRMQKVTRVQDNFAAALTLDPGLIDAYFFAGVVIGEDKETIEEGNRFLRRHQSKNPGEWKIFYWQGFNHYLLGEHVKAAYLYEKAANLKDSPLFLRSNQPMFFYLAGKADMGVLFLEGLLDSIEDPGQVTWIELKLNWLKNIVFLQEKVGEFKLIYGGFPGELSLLVDHGLIDSVPQDPFGRGYYFDRETQRVKSRFAN